MRLIALLTVSIITISMYGFTVASVSPIVLPCGVATTYTSGNMTQGMQLYIGYCYSATYSATTLRLDFSKSTAAPPSDVAVTVEHSANVNVAVLGNAVSGNSTLLNFTIAMSNVTTTVRPSSSVPSCAASPSDPYCSPVLRMNAMHVHQGRFFMNHITYLHAISSVLLVDLSVRGGMNDTEISCTNIIHSGAQTLLIFNGSDATRSNLSGTVIAMRNISMAASLDTGLSATQAVLLLHNLAITSISVLLSNVNVSDAGIVGALVMARISSSSSSNATITLSNATLTSSLSRMSSLLLLDACSFISSLLTLRSVFVFGKSPQLMLWNLSDVTMTNATCLIEKAYIFSSYSTFLGAISIQTLEVSQSLIVVRDVTVVGDWRSRSTQVVLLCLFQDISSHSSTIIVDGAAIASPEVQVAVVSFSSLSSTTLQVTNCELHADSGLAVHAYSCPRVESFNLMIADCYIEGDAGVVIEDMNMTSSAMSVTSTTTYCSYAAIIFSDLAASGCVFNVSNINESAASGLTLWLNSVALANSSSLTILTAAGSHYVPVLFATSATVSNKSSILAAFPENIVYSSLVVLLVQSLTLAMISTMTITLAKNVSYSSNALAKNSPFTVTQTLLASGSSIIFQGDDTTGRSTSVVRWPHSIAVFYFDNVTVLDGTVQIRNMKARNTIATKLVSMGSSVQFQNCTFRDRSMLVVTNVAFALVNATKSSYTYGIVFVNVAGNQVQLQFRNMQCQYRDDLELTPLVDPGNAVCMLFKNSWISGSLVSVTNLTSPSTSAFMVVSIINCQLSSSTFQVADASTITLVASQRVQDASGAYNNNMFYLDECVILNTTISLLSGSTITPLGNVQVGLPANLVVIRLSNSIASFCLIAVSSSIIQFPADQCKNTTSQSVILTLSNFTATGGNNAFRVAGVLVRQPMTCSSLIAVDGATIVSGVLAITITGATWRGDCSNAFSRSA